MLFLGCFGNIPPTPPASFWARIIFTFRFAKPCQGLWGLRFAKLFPNLFVFTILNQNLLAGSVCRRTTKSFNSNLNINTSLKNRSPQKNKAPNAQIDTCFKSHPLGKQNHSEWEQMQTKTPPRKSDMTPKCLA